jgi:S1-C subfamily serine protease
VLRDDGCAGTRGIKEYVCDPMTTSVQQDSPPQPPKRLHPLAVTALIVAFVGIPLFGLLTGAIAAILAGVALGQIAGNPRLRGRGIAVAAVFLGIGDMVIWVAIIGIALPRMNVPDAVPLKRTISPSFHAPQGAPDPIRRAMEANVFLVVDKPRRWPFLGTESYSGSGVILDKQESGCIILTNRHVVDPYFVADDPGSVPRSAAIRVYFHDASSGPARVWWVDPRGADMALIATGKVPDDLAIAMNGKIRDMRIGDKVFAVGNPHELSWSYAEGVISGMRELPQGADNLQVLQLQVPINQGNSGGGLYATDGTLVGIVSWTKDKAQAEGISFAIRYQDFLSHFREGRTRREP